MILDLHEYCESENENPNVKNKATAYEYLVKRRFEEYFENKDDYKLNLFPIIGTLTPDLELSIPLKGREFVIPIEIKFFYDLSENGKNARTKARKRMREYEGAYREKLPNATIIPLFITQNPSFNNNPDKYQCVVVTIEELREKSETIIQEIEPIIRKNKV
jgi:hypothetical protein